MYAKTHMTIAEFEQVAARLGPCELVRGEVVKLAPAGFPRSRITVNVAARLDAWARRTRRGRVVAAEMGLVPEAKRGTVRGADVAYFSYRRLPRGAEPEGFARVPPELAVEVVGKGQGWREIVEKAGEYLRMGVERVWVIHPKSRRLHVLRPDDEPSILNEKALLTDRAILPGFRCRVREFFQT
jgi:Uma2 family endonuclease